MVPNTAWSGCRDVLLHRFTGMSWDKRVNKWAAYVIEPRGEESCTWGFLKVKWRLPDWSIHSAQNW